MLLHRYVREQPLRTPDPRDHESACPRRLPIGTLRESIKPAIVTSTTPRMASEGEFDLAANRIAIEEPDCFWPSGQVSEASNPVICRYHLA